jgi:RNA polymerase sigma-70 factor, ECF subfamily
MISTLTTELGAPAWPSGLAKKPIQEADLPDQGVAATIKQVLAGNVNAFNQLVLDYQGLAYNVAYQLVHSEDAAADVVQDAFLKAYRALPCYRGGNFKTWLLRIVVNTCYDLLREQQRRPSTPLETLANTPTAASVLADPAERPEAYVVRMETRQWLEEGLRSLPVDQRSAVVLYDVQGYSYEEMAEILNVPLGTVKSRLNRGRIRLRDYLYEHGQF